MTGRNHHEVGMRSVADVSTGFPNMRGSISSHAARLAEVLRDEGYATLAVGNGICARWKTRRRARSGRAMLVIDGSECGSLDIPFVMLMLSSTGPSVGFDHGSPVTPR